MANFALVGDYLGIAQSITQDLAVVRYSPQQYMDALNTGIAESFRVRPDFFRTEVLTQTGDTAPPMYLVGQETSPINYPKQFALPLILFIAGLMELIDAEGNEDDRAKTLIGEFTAKLTKLGA